jgi:UDP-2,3-diacylglucosamine hydrolase
MDLRAPSHWRTLEFHSDVHLFDQDPLTFLAWQHYLASSQADAVFILGDLFEVWVGDDTLDGDCEFERTCADVLRASACQRPTFFLPGNRDFLLGDRFLRSVGVQRLPDPCTLVFQDQRIMLSHGDALCTDDTTYQQFRHQVRSPQWIRNFLAQALHERQAIARQIRQASELRKQASGQYVDVNPQAVAQAMQAQRADSLVHGHTHLPAVHSLNNGCQRLVLSDWCASSLPPRLEILRLQVQASGLAFTRVPVAPPHTPPLQP